MLYILGIEFDKISMTNEDKEMYQNWRSAVKGKKDFKTADTLRQTLIEKRNSVMEIVTENATSLAWIGDAVMSLAVREHLLSLGFRKAHVLQKKKCCYL